MMVVCKNLLWLCTLMWSRAGVGCCVGGGIVFVLVVEVANRCVQHTSTRYIRNFGVVVAIIL